MNYQKAHDIDKIVGELLRLHPITKENALMWMNFARTIETSMKIIITWASNEIEETNPIINALAGK